MSRDFAHWTTQFSFVCENLSRCLICENGNLCKSIELKISCRIIEYSIQKMRKVNRKSSGVYNVLRTICESDLSMTKRDQHHMNERMNSTTSMKWSVFSDS